MDIIKKCCEEILPYLFLISENKKRIEELRTMEHQYKIQWTEEEKEKIRHYINIHEEKILSHHEIIKKNSICCAMLKKIQEENKKKKEDEEEDMMKKLYVP